MEGEGQGFYLDHFTAADADLRHPFADRSAAADASGAGFSFAPPAGCCGRLAAASLLFEKPYPVFPRFGAAGRSGTAVSPMAGAGGEHGGNGAVYRRVLLCRPLLGRRMAGAKAAALP